MHVSVKRLTVPVALVFMSAFLLCSTAIALENSVVVESKEVIPGQTNVRIGVYISNADPIVALVIPLELRALSTSPPYSFHVAWGVNNNVHYAGRLYHSPLGTGYPIIPGSVTLRTYVFPSLNTCSGPISSSYWITSQLPDDRSPTGTLLACFSQGDPNAGYEIHLSPGSEIPGRDTASYYIHLNANSVPGQFVIDTCCVLPANHLAYADADGNLIPVSFTPGIVTIGCFCRCHGDPDCNGYLDIVDVVRTVNTAFRGLSEITDQDCTHARTDVDANAMTNVLDVARMIDVVFGGQALQDVFVDPCAE